MTDQKFAPLLPYDEHNQELESHVHPPDWENPSPSQPYHLVAIGAGTAGLVTVAGAAGLGARVALIERELMGGDCLNVGCVPSKGLISAARVAATVRNAAPFGVNVNDSTVDFGKSIERMRAKRAQISPVDSARRFREMGVDVFFGSAKFIDDETISITRSNGSSTELKFKRAAITSGARAATPDIPGLDSVNFLTNETLYSLTEIPTRLGVVGGGPIGCEMAQAFARLGSEVFVFERSGHILSREDDDAAAVVQTQFEQDGINLVLNSQDLKLDAAGDSIRISGQRGTPATPYEVTVDQLLLATGRTPNTGDLNLEAVNVNYDQHGVEVNDQLQTTNPKIFAAGDICSNLKFTHAADFQARIVIQNALFALGPFGKKKNSNLVIPWTTYTSPEIAHVGLYEKDAKEQGIEIDTYVQQLEHVDRAILEGKDEGFVKVHTRKGTDKILGATIVAENAGDLISVITVAMTHGLGLAKIGSTIHPYPTQAEAIRRLGDQYNKSKLTPVSKMVLGFLRRLNVGK